MKIGRSQKYYFAALVAALMLMYFGTAPLASAFTGQSDPLSPADDYRIRKVVIDAGHGGHDAGCSGANSKEKHIALAIALKLGGYIEERIPDVEVIYTRKTDVFVELHERAAIANREKADLFISIHCNANHSHSPYGTETYVMGLHKNSANLSVAKRENDVILLEDDFNAHYDGFDPSTPNAHIIFSLFQSAYLDQSILFASMIEDQFANRVNRRSRGVKQAGFLVLYKTAMPSVLVETGFLSNRKEENFLHSAYGQDLMASAIFRAFRDYKQQMEARYLGDPIALSNPEVIETNPSESPETQSETEPPAQATIAGNTEGTTQVKIEQVSSQQTAAEAGQTPENESVNIKMHDQKVYLVQIYASNKIYKPTDPIFSDIAGEPIQLVQEKQLYKYMVGEYTDPEEARKKKEELRQRGFKDAFLVSWIKQVPVTDDQASIR